VTGHAGAGVGPPGGLDLLCLGEPMLEFNQRPPTAEGTALYLAGHGGDTSNAAIAAARQGARVGYATAIGSDDAGDSFMALWAREGVDTSAVRRDPRHATASYFVRHDAAGHHFQYYRCHSAASHYAPADLPREAIAAARMLYASGISQAISDSAADAVFEAIAIARAHGRRVAYDTNYRPRLWPVPRAAAVIHAAVAQCDIVLPSLEDATALTGLADADRIADFYLRLGPGIVALKLGARGALLATCDGRCHLPPHPCRAIDATGAGDTFTGSFLSRLLAGDAPEQAARYAGCAAALMTEGYGAVAPIPHAMAVRAALGGLGAG
jgi:2-dehydro-3-deoxygluconokinase